MIVVRPAPLARPEKSFNPYSAREPGTWEPALTTLVSIRKGHDVRYFTNAGGVGCAGAMAYYTRGGEPSGQWEGKAAARLGLAGPVDPGILDRLFMENIAPAGEVLAKRHQGRDDEQAEEAAVREFRKKHFYASVTEVAEFRAAQRAKSGPKSVPYFDITVSAVKSVSVLHASLRVDAMQARAAGRTEYAEALDARASEIEQAVLEAAREAVRWLEQYACYTRTGYHSATTGEWRDGDRLAAALFLHHLSRDGDPQLHVHAAIWNRVQRADAADEKWRTLFGRALYQQRLGLAPVPDRFLEARLRKLGYVMVPRRDGNGCEVGGVSHEVMDRFSSRGVAVTGELARLAAEWERIHCKPPSKRVLWQLHQQAGQNTRRAKAEARRTVNGRVHGREPTDAERLAEWEAQTTASEMQALSAVHVQAERFARQHARARGIPAPEPAPGTPESVRLPPVPWQVLSDEEKRRAARVAVAEAQRHHATWSMAQLRFEVHRAVGAGLTEADVTQIAGLAVSGRAGTGVVQVGAAPDITDVSSMGIRASDGVSVYRPPGEERWCTIDHLDLEAHVVAQARQRVPRLVSEE
jgi:conjugative relaxase-like TrwC/TraI family protein